MAYHEPSKQGSWSCSFDRARIAQAISFLCQDLSFFTHKSSLDIMVIMFGISTAQSNHPDILKKPESLMLVRKQKTCRVFSREAQIKEVVVRIRVMLR